MELDLTLPAFEPLSTALVVDDDDDIRYLLRHVLLREGFIVREAGNGRDATEIIRTTSPVDIVILDLMLPYIDGFQLTTRIREDRDWRDVPIIVISGYARPSGLRP